MNPVFIQIYKYGLSDILLKNTIDIVEIAGKLLFQFSAGDLLFVIGIQII